MEFSWFMMYGWVVIVLLSCFATGNQDFYIEKRTGKCELDLTEEECRRVSVRKGNTKLGQQNYKRWPVGCYTYAPYAGYSKVYFNKARTGRDCSDSFVGVCFCKGKKETKPAPPVINDFFVQKKRGRCEVALTADECRRVSISKGKYKVSTEKFPHWPAGCYLYGSYIRFNRVETGADCGKVFECYCSIKKKKTPKTVPALPAPISAAPSSFDINKVIPVTAIMTMLLMVL